jgi:hypothetical protein
MERLSLYALLTGQWCLCYFGNTGGPGSDSSQQTTSTTTNTDKRQVVDNGAIGISADQSDVYLETTDQGSVARSFDLATTSSEQTLNTMAKALGFATDTLKASRENSTDALGFVRAANADALAAVQAAGAGIRDAYANASELSSGQSYLVAGVVGAVVIVAVIALKRGG